MTWVKLFGLTAVVFLVLDLVWLGKVSPALYNKYISDLRAPDVNKIAALAFYVLFVAGMVYFVIQPAVAAENWQRALFVGAFFGLVTYATFDLTNLAVIKDWSVTVTLIDLVWGTFITATTSAIVAALAIRWGW